MPPVAAAGARERAPKRWGGSVKAQPAAEAVGALADDDGLDGEEAPLVGTAPAAGVQPHKPPVGGRVQLRFPSSGVREFVLGCLRLGLAFVLGYAAGAGALTSKKSSPVGSATLTVFYHVYQADSPDGERLSSDIVKEQMCAVKSSAAFGEGLILKYVFVGPRASGVPALLDCPACHQLDRRETGGEVLTLQHLFDHCRTRTSQGVEERVLYMHSKGSFHSTRNNEALRRFLTKGIWSDECLHMPQACSACSSRFSPLPHQHYPGNMWVARCDYVSRLIPPSEFEAAMGRVALLPGAAPPLVSGDEGESGWELGLGRFSSEHWLPSHPLHAPCDVYNGTDFRWANAFAFVPATNWAPKLHVLPRSDMPLGRYCISACDQNLTKVKAWRHFEWQALYPEAPLPGVLWNYYKTNASGMCSDQPGFDKPKKRKNTSSRSEKHHPWDPPQGGGTIHGRRRQHPLSRRRKP